MKKETFKKQAKPRPKFFHARETHDILMAVKEIGEEYPTTSWHRAAMRAAFFLIDSVTRATYQPNSGIDEIATDLKFARHDSVLAELRYHEGRKQCASALHTPESSTSKEGARSSSTTSSTPAPATHAVAQ